MREISKYGRIYCQQNHNKWAELVPHVEMWLNNTFASTALDTPVDLCLPLGSSTSLKN